MRKKYINNFLLKRNIKRNWIKLFKQDTVRKKFKRKNKNFKINIKINKTYIFSLLIIISISLIYFLFIWQTFKIVSIEITRKDNISNINIAYNSLESIRNKYLFSIDEDFIIDKLEKYQNNLQFIKINKKFPDKIKIEIWSYKPLFNTVVNNNNYIITSNWTLVPSQHSENLINLQLIWEIQEEKSFTIPDYKKIIKETNINKIISIYKKITENLIWIKINYISYYQIEREVHFSINNNLLLIFDLTQDLKKQVKNFIVFNTNNLKLIKDNIIYIDLRIDNKIFYCEKDNEYKCNLNINSIYKKNSLFN